MRFLPILVLKKRTQEKNMPQQLCLDILLCKNHIGSQEKYR